MRRTVFSDYQYHRTVEGDAAAESSRSGGGYADGLEQQGRWGVRSLAQQVPSAAYATEEPSRVSDVLNFFPCKSVAAEVERKTSWAVLLQQYDEVCARLMQAKKGSKLYSRVANLELAVALMNVFLAFSLDSTNASNRIRHGCLAIGLVGSGGVHRIVSQQFHRIKLRCETALRARFGDVFYNQIDGLVRDEDGFRRAIELLRAQGGDTGFLDQKLAELQARGDSSSWVARMLLNVGL